MQNDETLRIPFSIFDSAGSIEIEYRINASPYTSGFDVLKEIVPDLNICVGYPTVRAFVKDLPGPGYYRYCGWIQVLRMEFYSDSDGKSPDDIYYDADVLPVMKANKLPFFAYGYPAEFYDAPCNNFFSGAKLVWTADTFLISMPSYVNDNSISFFAGFQWGYAEYNSESRKRIDISPLKTIDRASWEKHFEMFHREYQNWCFS